MTPKPPTGYEHIRKFLEINQSPVSCVAGKMYKVPCIRHELLGPRWKGWIPLVGNIHEDADVIGFDPWHVHADWRFLPPALDELSRVVTLSPGTLRLHWSKIYHLIRVNADLEVRRKMCRRAEPPTWPEQSSFRGKLEDAYSGCRLIGGHICPHRGINVACGNELRPGLRQCPGHGLAWNQDGTLHRLEVAK